MADGPIPDVTGAPDVSITASPATARAEGEASNPDLQLAQALGHVNQELPPFMEALGAKLQATQRAKAFRDAFASSAKPFADAVRDGDIAPTQNPWYIKAYNEQSASLTARREISSAIATNPDLIAARNDPDAYATTLQNVTGQIGEQFTTKDGQLGFNEVAGPQVAEAVQQNQGYNSQRIQQENLQNTTSAATQAIQDLLAKTPSATPDQIFATMDDAHKVWTQVQGGSESSWRLIVRQAVVGAAANLGRSDLVDSLKAPYEGGPPIANQADETGKPVGLELSTDKFWIDRGLDASMAQEYKMHQAAVAGEGAKVDAWANTKYGDDYAFGKIPLQTLEQEGQQQGFSGEAIAWAANQQAEHLRGLAGYSQGQVAVYSSDPAVQATILGLEHAADTTGLTTGLYAKLNDMIVKQQISLEQAEHVTDRAQGQSHFGAQMAHEDANASRSLNIQQQELQLHRSALIGDAAKDVKAQARQTLQGFGYKPEMISRQLKDMDDAIDGAAASASLGGQSPDAATTAARTAAATWITTYNQKHHHPAAAPSANPNRP